MTMKHASWLSRLFDFTTSEKLVFLMRSCWTKSSLMMYSWQQAGRVLRWAQVLWKSKIPILGWWKKSPAIITQWWDGTGFRKSNPGTRDTVVLLQNQTALADVFDALTHKRP